MDKDNKCNHILDNGERCKAFALKEKDYCFSHDPESREEKALAVRKGGLVKPIRINGELAVIQEIETPEDITKVLGQTIREVREGKIPPQMANTIGFLSGHFLRAYEVIETERKIDQIEAVLGDRKFTYDSNKRRNKGR